MTSPRPRVYLAGPDVFRPDAAQYFALLSAACERLGLEALSPFDASVTAATSPHRIYEANMAKLRAADGVVANLAPFRGAEPDSGTVFEVGVAVALGVPVVAYGAAEAGANLRNAAVHVDSAEEALQVLAEKLGTTSRA
ncbi:nucleoside 2-deoxyribosyltransferase [Variovorax boronicumulans]|uniref:nucleoside 2-deoxyribosyltransferase n=1 Tax=Variovorax boronicumulans TaxID=436515 RepID=UPI0027888720|nr:nucleoside 2-deoxyribosyltransferase [Variovorax boronicumulans]MDP9991950.1 nucleoside 2-deoxyribosyltransferase [Variovorax boronicumulans]MDQ0001845.1 nucleoside 2-deoxyribosyltransferase [Variovorax boronicumulans]